MSKRSELHAHKGVTFSLSSTVFCFFKLSALGICGKKVLAKVPLRNILIKFYAVNMAKGHRSGHSGS